jgi:hypothetical protein
MAKTTTANGAGVGKAKGKALAVAKAVGLTKAKGKAKAVAKAVGSGKAKGKALAVAKAVGKGKAKGKALAAAGGVGMGKAKGKALAAAKGVGKGKAKGKALAAFARVIGRATLPLRGDYPMTPGPGDPGAPRTPITFVLKDSGKHFTLLLHDRFAIDMIKARIRLLEGRMVSQQRLIHCDQVLENGRLLSDYNIQRDHVVYVEKDEPVTVLVLMADGTALFGDRDGYPLLVKTSDTIEDVKAKILYEFDLGPPGTELAVSHGLWDDMRTVGDFCIARWSRLFISLPAGGAAASSGFPPASQTSAGAEGEA